MFDCDDVYLVFRHFRIISAMSDIWELSQL